MRATPAVAGPGSAGARSTAIAARGLIALAIVLAGCTTKRAAAFGALTTVGAVGMGVPLAHDCTPNAPGDCGFAHDAKYFAAGAMVGAALGALVVYEMSRDRPRDPADPVRLVADDGLMQDVAVEPLPAVAPRPARPPPPLGSLPLGPIAACVDAERAHVDSLERRCRLEVRDAVDDLCSPGAEMTCGPVTEAARILGFAIGEEAIATASATEQARLKCWEAGGTHDDVVTRCECGLTCGCVAEVACLPARGVP